MSLERVKPPERSGEPPTGPEAASRASSLSLTVAWVVGFAVFAYLVRQILLPFALAGIVAFVATPLIDGLARRTRVGRPIFALGLWVLLMGFAVLICWLCAAPLLEALERLGAHPQDTVAGYVRLLIGAHTFNLAGEHLDAARIAALLVDQARRWLEPYGTVAMLGAWGAEGIAVVLLSWVLLGYFLLDAHRIGSGLAWLIPPHRRALFAQVGRELVPILRRYFLGIAIVMAYAFCTAYIGLGLVLGLRHALFLALLTGLLELIPFLGPASALVLAGLATLEQSATMASLLTYVIYAAVLRLSIDQLVGPVVLGRAAHVRPVLVIFCFLCGGLLFGIVGAMLAVPTALGIKVLLGAIYRQQGEG